MTEKRNVEIKRMIEGCRQTDNTDVEVEKTEVLAELLAEVERLREQILPIEKR